MTRMIVGFVMTGVLLLGGLASAFGESLFWTIQGDSNIYRSQLDGSDQEVFMTFGHPDEVPTGLAVDYANGYLYSAVASPGSGKILRTKLGALEQPEVVATTSHKGVAGLALDIQGGYVYWTAPTDGVIERASLNGGAVTTILTGLGSPNGICVDNQNHKLVWSESSTGIIRRSNLNGTSIEASLFSGLSSPQGLALDSVGHSLYWAETGEICHGPTGDSVLTGLGNVFGLDIDQRGHQMYWSCPNGSSQGIYRANLNGTGQTLLIDGVAAGFIALAVPEPSCIVLAGTGLLGLLAWAWRRRMKNG